MSKAATIIPNLCVQHTCIHLFTNEISGKLVPPSYRLIDGGYCITNDGGDSIGYLSRLCIHIQYDVPIVDSIEMVFTIFFLGVLFNTIYLLL